MSTWSLNNTLPAVLVAVFSTAASASAQQPLEEFLRSAREGGAVDVREAEANAGEARSRVDEARARLLPSLSITGGYTRNQEEVSVDFPSGPMTTDQVVITPINQLDGRATLTVPIVDVSAWSTFFGAESSADAADERVDGVAIDVAAQVVTEYYAVVAARAVRDAAARTLAASEENLGVVGARVGAGLASEVDRQRAIVDVERAHQSEAEAELAEALAMRRLFVVSGLEPGSQRSALDDGLSPEQPLASWIARVHQLPTVRAAAYDVRSAERTRDAAWQRMLPTIAATAQERLTNAAGFGVGALWSVGVTASFLLDFGAPATIGTDERRIDAARARADRARLAAETSIHDAWHRVRSLVARARAARASEEASARAADVSRARYQAGTGTQLEVSQAERDLFSAEVARIQADADLRVARLALRVRSGLPATLDGGAS